MKRVLVVILLVGIISIINPLMSMEPRPNALPQDVQMALNSLSQRMTVPNLPLSVLGQMLAEVYRLARMVSYSEQLYQQIYPFIGDLSRRIEQVMDIRDGQPPQVGDYNADYTIREIYARLRMQVADRPGWYGMIQQGNSPYWG